jgi:hypothetical protein
LLIVVFRSIFQATSRSSARASFCLSVLLTILS